MEVVDEAVVTTPQPGCGAAAVGEPGWSSPSPAASPEFEFWMVGKNPASFQSPALLTADELFSDGVVLPLRTLQQVPSADGDGKGEDGNDTAVESSVLPEAAVGEVEGAQRVAESGPAPTPDLPAVTFKWKDIFKATGGGGETKDRKKMERRVSSVGGNGELININIWPFSRSRSAGHSAGGGGAGALTRNKSNPNANANAANASNAAAAAATSPAAAAAPGAARKVSSAPCSRSNSRGETSTAAPATPSIATAACAAAATAPAAPAPVGPVAATSMLRRLVPGQGRTGGLTVTGIRLGRASPVWQLRRNKLQQQGAAAEQKQSTNATTTTTTTAAAKKKAAPVATTPTTTTTTQDVDGEDKAAPSATTPPAAAAATTGCRNNASCSEAGGEEASPPQGLFGLRTFFSKKVY